jgi:hypothetical protein
MRNHEGRKRKNPYLVFGVDGRERERERERLRWVLEHQNTANKGGSGRITSKARIEMYCTFGDGMLKARSSYEPVVVGYIKC